MKKKPIAHSIDINVVKKFEEYIKNSNCAKANTLLKENPQLAHYVSDAGETLLLSVIKSSFADKANKLITTFIENGANPNSKSKTELHSAFFLACSKGLLSAVKIMLPKAEIDQTGRLPNQIIPSNRYHRKNKKNSPNLEWVDNTGSNLGEITVLAAACYKGHLEIVKYLLENRADINKGLSNGTAPLLVACRYGWIEITKVLINNGANLNYNNLLSFAVLSGKIEVVEYLIQRDISVNECADGTNPPLAVACFENYLHIVKLLIKAGADINKPGIEGTTPLMFACANKHWSIIEYLVSHPNIDINKQTQSGTALSLLCSLEEEGEEDYHLDTIRYLVENNADITLKQDGATPLSLACEQTNAFGIVRFLANQLVSKGISISTPDDDGMTPLHHCCNFDNFTLIKFLIKEMNHPVNCTNKECRTPFNYALEGSNLDILDYLYKNGATIDHPTLEGDTPLHLACRLGKTEVVKFLIEKKAPLDISNQRGETPLHIALLEEFENIALSLINAGAALHVFTVQQLTPVHLVCRNGYLNILKILQNKVLIDEIDAKKKTPFLYACQNGHLEIVQYLKNIGANINLSDKYGRTPLHMACMEKEYEIAKFLIESGADISKFDMFGQTALFIACAHGNFEIIDLLIKHPASAEIDYMPKIGLWLWSPLDIACIKGHIKIVFFLIPHLIKKTTILSTKDINLFFLTCRHGNVQTLEMLFSHVELSPENIKDFNTKFSIDILSDIINTDSEINKIEILSFLIKTLFITDPQKINDLLLALISNRSRLGSEFITQLYELIKDKPFVLDNLKQGLKYCLLKHNEIIGHLLIEILNKNFYKIKNQVCPTYEQMFEAYEKIQDIEKTLEKGKNTKKISYFFNTQQQQDPVIVFLLQELDLTIENIQNYQRNINVQPQPNNFIQEISLIDDPESSWFKGAINELTPGVIEVENAHKKNHEFFACSRKLLDQLIDWKIYNNTFADVILHPNRSDKYETTGIKFFNKTITLVIELDGVKLDPYKEVRLCELKQQHDHQRLFGFMLSSDDDSLKKKKSSKNKDKNENLQETKTLYYMVEYSATGLLNDDDLKNWADRWASTVLKISSPKQPPPKQVLQSKITFSLNQKNTELKSSESEGTPPEQQNDSKSEILEFDTLSLSQQENLDLEHKEPPKLQ